jgi:hypothetical protein
MKTGATIPADFGPASTERTSAPALSFGATEVEAESAVVVHFTVLSENPSEVLAIARVIEGQLVGQRIGSRAVTWIVTDTKAESSLTTLAPLVSHITAEVKKTLGIR